MYIIGHRGAAGLAPENTILAIEIAKENKVDAIECDVQSTKDGRLVLAHDDTLLRITGRAVKIKNLTLSKVIALNTKSGYPIPSLDEAIQTAGRTPLVIEGKYDDWAVPLANVLRSHKGPKPKVISYNHRELFMFAGLMPNIETYANEDHHPIEAMILAKNLNFTGVSLATWLYNPISYLLSKKHGLKLITSPINPTWRIRLFHFFWPRAMITTDYPDRVMNHNLRRRKK